MLGNGNAATTLIGGGNGDGLSGGVGNLIVTGGGTELVGLAASDTLFTAAIAGDFDQVMGNGAGGRVGLGFGAARLTDLAGGTVFGGAGAATVRGPALQLWGGSGALVGATVAGTGPRFGFFDGPAGGTDTVENFNSSAVHIVLHNYGSNEVANAVDTQSYAGGNTSPVLSDGTHILLIGVTGIAASAFLTA